MSSPIRLTLERCGCQLSNTLLSARLTLAEKEAQYDCLVAAIVQLSGLKNGQIDTVRRQLVAEIRSSLSLRRCIAEALLDAFAEYEQCSAGLRRAAARKSACLELVSGLSSLGVFSSMLPLLLASLRSLVDTRVEHMLAEGGLETPVQHALLGWIATKLLPFAAGVLVPPGCWLQLLAEARSRFWPEKSFQKHRGGGLPLVLQALRTLSAGALSGASASDSCVTFSPFNERGDGAAHHSSGMQPDTSSSRQMIADGGSSLQAFSHVQSYLDLLAEQLCDHAYLTLLRGRTGQLFDIIREFPESRPAVRDLASTVAELGAPARALVSRSLVAALHARLLHPGAPTATILEVFVTALKVLQLVDPSGVVVVPVADAVRTYLRQRNDTVREIVHSLTEDTDSVLHAELGRRRDRLEAASDLFGDSAPGSESVAEAEDGDGGDGDGPLPMLGPGATAAGGGGSAMVEEAEDGGDQLGGPLLRVLLTPLPLEEEATGHAAMDTSSSSGGYGAAGERIGEEESDQIPTALVLLALLGTVNLPGTAAGGGGNGPPVSSARCAARLLPFLLPAGSSAADPRSERRAAGGALWRPGPREGEGGKPRLALDLLATLVGIFGSPESFVAEYRTLLSERLLGKGGDDYDTEQDERTLELLKLRFGDAALSSCEVMLRDVADSRRISKQIRPAAAAALAGCEKVETTVLSGHFWPPMAREKATLAPALQLRFSAYAAAYAQLRKPRHLDLHAQAGLVELEISSSSEEGPAVPVLCTTLQASVLLSLAQRASAPVAELAKLLGVSVPKILNAASFWALKGVLRLEQPHDAAPHDDASLLLCVVTADTAEKSYVGESHAGGSMAAQHMGGEAGDEEGGSDAEAAEVHANYVLGMLSNLGSLPLDRVHNTLKLFSSMGDHPYEKSAADLSKFLATLVRGGRVHVRDGLYSAPE